MTNQEENIKIVQQETMQNENNHTEEITTMTTTTGSSNKSTKRIYKGLEYDMNEEPFKSLGKNAIKRLLKEQLWEKNRQERTKQQREKHKLKRKERQKLVDEGVLEPLPKRVKSKDMILGNRKVIIDCAFSDLMNEKEIHSLQSQLVRCYSANRLSKEAMQLTISSFDSILEDAFHKKTPSYKNWLNVEFDSKNYEDQFDKSKLVYLSADSDNVAHELEEDKIYIIGGIVDKNRHKGLCQDKATRQEITTAQLPIGDYIQMASRKVLTVNQVYEIMLKWVEYRDWEKAFLDIIPQRKLKDSTVVHANSDQKESDSSTPQNKDKEEEEEDKEEGETN
ncbi:unnamed protein product [Cunninghamella blakesleeana]